MTNDAAYLAEPLGFATQPVQPSRPVGTQKDSSPPAYSSRADAGVRHHYIVTVPLDEDSAGDLRVRWLDLQAGAEERERIYPHSDDTSEAAQEATGIARALYAVQMEALYNQDATDESQ